MRIIITERQFKELISEETTGVDSFFDIINKSFFNTSKYKSVDDIDADDIPDDLLNRINQEKETNGSVSDDLRKDLNDWFSEKLGEKIVMSDELKSEIQRVFDETGTKNIKFDTFKIPALGLSTPDGVILNSNILNRGFYEVLFILFHELAHQYQYKKYGDKVMLDLYFDEMSLEDAAKFMLDVEHVADEYGVRKLKQMIRRGLIPERFGEINDNTLKRYKGYTNINERSLMGMISHTKDLMRKNNITNHEQVSEFMYNLIKGQI